MARKKTSKQDTFSDSQQAGQGDQGKEPRTATWADVEASFSLLRERANRGDREAQAALIRYVNATPALRDRLGDMAQRAETALIDEIAEGDWLTARAIRQGTAELRQQLSRPSQSPLEDLAVQRLVGCWEQLQLVESMCAQADMVLLVKAGMP